MIFYAGTLVSAAAVIVAAAVVAPAAKSFLLCRTYEKLQSG